MSQRGTTLGEIAALLKVNLGPAQDAAASIDAVSHPRAATGTSLVFASDAASLREALQSPAGAILAPLDTVAEDPRVLQVRQPRTALAEVYARWFDRRGGGGIHDSAVVEPGAILGAGCEIGPGCFVAAGALLGDQCILGPRVTVCAHTTLGARVKVQAGTVLGSDGFGYAHTPTGYIGFPQIGTLWIGDDVEIGANCTIDRGALGETRIGRGTKIDNLCHIAHNCVLGEHCLLAAQAGMAGSCVIEDGAMLGGQVGLGEGVTIGRGVVLGGQGGVLPGKRIDGEGVVYWGTPAQPVREYLRNLARMRRG
jgi:UDP-3-O-[3-hydroxymyristoyl] glucosamine N-acyltransferase